MRVVLLAYTQLNPSLPETLRQPLSAGRTPQEALVEYAARVCYHSVDKLGHSDDFIQARIREGHEDVIEHSQATFLIEGVSRACTHQLVRHRLASFSQESQRYTDLSKLKDEQLLIVPQSIADNPEAMAIWEKTVGDVADAYHALRKLGVRKEDARFLLPNAATTRLVTSMNFRAWRHFLWLRCDKAAQWEIREVAMEILRQLYPLAPSIFADLWKTFIEPEAAEGSGQ